MGHHHESCSCTLSPASAEDVLTKEQRVLCPTAQCPCSSLGQKGYFTLYPRVSPHQGLEMCFAVAISEQCNEKVSQHSPERGTRDGAEQCSAPALAPVPAQHLQQVMEPVEVCTRHSRKTLWIHTEAPIGDTAKDGTTQDNPMWASWH